MGDDIVDLRGARRASGLSAAPADAVDEVRVARRLGEPRETAATAPRASWSS